MQNYNNYSLFAKKIDKTTKKFVFLAFLSYLCNR